jgi:hypothetical protein
MDLHETTGPDRPNRGTAGRLASRAVSNESIPDVVELPVGTDVGTIEVILARLQSDGIPVTVEPDLSSLSAVDEEGFRLVVRTDDVVAVVPVLQAAGIDITPLG